MLKNNRGHLACNYSIAICFSRQPNAAVDP